MTADSHSLVARLPGCGRLGPEALDEIVRTSRIECAPVGARLVEEGAPVPDWYGLIDAGTARVTRTGAGSEQVLEVLAHGDVVDPGEPGRPAACSIVVSEPLRWLVVPQSVVATHRGRSPVAPSGVDRGEAALFVRRVADLLNGPAVTCEPEAPAAEVARVMTGRGVGSVIVARGDGTPIGIVTDRDLRSRVLARGLPPSTAVVTVMSSPLVSVSPERSAFDALLEMTRRGIHHLGVVADGRLVGVVSSHDIVLLQGAHPVGLMRDIDAQGTLEALARAASRILPVVRWLAGAGAGACEIGRIVSELNDRLVRRTLALVVTSLEAQGQGRPPMPFSWLVAGSEGRREQTLKTDQDNGLVYEDPPPELAEASSSYFGRLAVEMGAALERLGFPPCPGGFMARNPRWCKAESGWRAEFASWMETPSPERLLDASIFFDLRPVGGDQEPGWRLWAWVCACVPSQTLFIRHMAKLAVERRAPLGLFGGFVVERSGAHRRQLDLKGRGVLPLAQAARLYALSFGVRETNTIDRLLAVGARAVFTQAQVTDLSDAYELMSRLRLEHQLACLDAGRPADNFIDPEGLGRADRMLLKEAFKSLAWLERHVEDRFMTDSIA